ncbi:hypothetical protein EDB85DRAFT_1891487 [Lactarius pseudohatsudake]|nr:hypothetical protein EDB85DRAFT_1891487 [Lactarius pseudohatsudake]
MVTDCTAAGPVGSQVSKAAESTNDDEISRVEGERWDADEWSRGDDSMYKDGSSFEGIRDTNADSGSSPSSTANITREGTHSKCIDVIEDKRRGTDTSLGTSSNLRKQVRGSMAGKG